MRTWRVTRNERRYVAAGVALAAVLLGIVAANDDVGTGLRVLAVALAGFNVWELALGPAHLVTVHDDGRVELRSPLRRGSLHATEIRSARRRAGDWRGRGPFVLRTGRGSWRVHRRLDPDVTELLAELRRHNPDLDVDV